MKQTFDPLARWLTLLAILAVALACGLAVSAEPVEAQRPPYLIEAGHPSRCYSQWLRRTEFGFYRTWFDDDAGRTWWLGDRFYTRAATPGDRY